MAQPSVNMPEELLEEIDTERDSTTSRSEWIRGAITQRLEIEGESQ